MKRPLKKACFLALVLLAPLRAGAQISFGLTSEGANFWFGLPTDIVVGAINGALSDISDDDDDDSSSSVMSSNSFIYEWLSFKDSDGKMDVDQGNFFGFKARDVFNHFGAGLTLGYRPENSFFGIYVNGGYRFRQFRINSDAITGKYKTNSWYAGLSIRIVPFTSLLDGWSPMIEVGTNYRQPFKCKSPYGTDCDQFGKGFSTVYALGVEIYGAATIKLQYEMFGYDYLNKDYTTSTGYKPFSDIDSKMHGFGLVLLYNF